MTFFNVVFSLVNTKTLKVLSRRNYLWVDFKPFVARGEKVISSVFCCRLEPFAFCLPVERVQLHRDLACLGRQRQRHHSRGSNASPPGCVLWKITGNHTGWFNLIINFTILSTDRFSEVYV
jgi:hypothetical protein